MGSELDSWTSLPRAGTDPYQVEHEEHTPLPPEPGSPPARPGSPPQPTRVELPGGRCIGVAIDHDGCADRAVHYTCKLLLRSPLDRVHLIHVQQKGHWQGGAATGGPLSQHGSAALTLSPLASASEGSLAIPAAPQSTPDSAAASAAPAPAAGLQAPPVRPAPPAAGSPAVGSSVLTQFGSAGWLGLASSGSSGSWSLSGPHRGAQQRGGGGQQPLEGCSQLLERCRQQLLAGSRRVRPDHVTLHLLPASKSQAKAIVQLCAQEGCDILVMGSRGSSGRRLLSMIGQGGSTASYCREHLPATRVVSLRPQQ